MMIILSGWTLVMTKTINDFYCFIENTTALLEYFDNTPYHKIIVQVYDDLFYEYGNYFDWFAHLST